MSDPYMGEIRTVGFTFAPPSWMLCNGQALNIAEYEALYSLIGTTYGGDGQTTFNLPNMQSRVNVAAGSGPGLSPYAPGATGGLESVTLTALQLPAHAHPFTASLNGSTNGAATSNAAGNYPGNGANIYSTSASSNTLGAGSITGTAQPTGGSGPHTNIQPVLALTCIICVEGIYPPRPQ